jgi:hypothetical protein
MADSAPKRLAFSCLNGKDSEGLEDCGGHHSRFSETGTRLPRYAELVICNRSEQSLDAHIRISSFIHCLFKEHHSNGLDYPGGGTHDFPFVPPAS